ncbi:MAG: hypothetical protein ACK4GQ_00370 [Candidatus Hadarchaeales archaeon]
MLLYILLIAGALAFGLEALLIGWGGKLTVIYGRHPWFTVGLASGLGLLIVFLTISISFLLQWLENQPIYVGVLALLLTVAVGKTVSPLKVKLVPKREIPIPKISDEELEKVIKRRTKKR